MVDELVRSYGGEFELGSSEWGGLAATVRLPGG
jgi:hypothetical protein